MSEDLKLCQTRLMELFHYCAESGSLTWKISRRRINIGMKAGALDSKGRVRVQIDGRSYGAHQIAYAIHYGAWSNDQVDHINGVKTDNRIANLRAATNAQNSRNRRRRVGMSGVRGVTMHKGRFLARVMMDGKSINLGSFSSPGEASAAYESAIIKYHGEFSCSKT